MEARIKELAGHIALGARAARRAGARATARRRLPAPRRDRRGTSRHAGAASPAAPAVPRSPRRVLTRVAINVGLRASRKYCHVDRRWGRRRDRPAPTPRHTLSPRPPTRAAPRAGGAMSTRPSEAGVTERRSVREPLGRVRQPQGCSGLHRPDEREPIASVRGAGVVRRVAENRGGQRRRHRRRACRCFVVSHVHAASADKPRTARGRVLRHALGS